MLPVGGLRPGVFEFKTVPVEPLAGGVQVGTSFWAPTTEMTFAAPQAYEAGWLPDAEAMTRVPSRVTALRALPNAPIAGIYLVHHCVVAPEPTFLILTALAAARSMATGS